MKFAQCHEISCVFFWTASLTAKKIMRAILILFTISLRTRWETRLDRDEKGVLGFLFFHFYIIASKTVGDELPSSK